MPETEKPAELPGYEKESVILSDIEVAVTDETQLVAENLVDFLQQQQPGLTMDIHPIDLTVTEPWWLQEPSVHAAFLSRPMTQQEKAEFTDQRGYMPTELRIGSDAVTVVVNPANPIAEQGITAAELDAVFGGRRARGHAPVQTWGQLGLSGDWAERPVQAIAQGSNDAVATHFRRMALLGGPYRTGIPRLGSASQVIDRVVENPAAIGLVARSRMDERVTAVAVSGWEEGEAALPADPAPDLDAPAYWLYLYLDQKPGSGLSATTEALVSFIYSDRGQQVIRNAGYEQVPAAIARDTLQALE